MTFLTQEQSVKDGRPIYLYQFGRGEEVWRYTSYPQRLTGILSNDWDESEIAHGDIPLTGNIERNTIDLTFGLNNDSPSNDFARDLLLPSLLTTTLTIWKIHRGDSEDEYEFAWKGRIVGAKPSGRRIICTSENVSTSLRRPGCRVRISKLCRHSHYGQFGCRLDIDDHLDNVEITVISGGDLVLTIPDIASAATNLYRAGVIKWNSLFSQIESSSGSTATLMFELPGLADAVAGSGGSLPVQIARGCNRVRLDSTYGCLSFDNTLNFGGFDRRPNRNPFNGSLT